ncbi:Zinc finger C2HC domain-containing protein 1A [Orchesella cincta]|uniref:Zinc finger C2HC domain-containing protein 1A n=1 Tax=Orchesella cincta TaxID=48709 RepID=A0A1D2MK99_ORCCI|nr:Zinc finger C2HC domain-containing protein 1A [Orchesella cincta]
MDSACMDISDNSSMSIDTKSELPAWRMPISTSFSSSLRERLNSPPKTILDNQKCPVDRLLSTSSEEESDMQNNVKNSNNNNNSSAMAYENKPAVSQNNKLEVEDDDEEGKLILILLPCIICNRTFSPEALERHAKVCTKVNTKNPYKPNRGTFDISEKRKKGTLLEDFIPPPTFDALTDNRFGLSRGSRNRSSLRGTSCTTRSTLVSTTPAPNTRRERSVSQSRERSQSRAPPSVTSPTDYPYDDTSEFGSNNSEENNLPDLPRYAQPIAPKDVCPYCNRTFGIKSYDRHVEFCKEIFERKRYEIQPTPKEKEEAMERQEIRTKYRPMKSSSSCSSLRSMSPAKDFASMAMKLFGGLRRTEGSTNLYFNQIKNNLKKSNESIAASCYGDYTRGVRRTSPSPVRTSSTAASAANKLNNLLTKSYLHQQQQQHHQQQQQQQQLHQQSFNQYHHQSGSLLPMRLNTSSNIPKMTKSTDSLNSGNNFAHVSSSGYGQPPSVMMMNSNNNSFMRNSRSRSSLHKNFFRTKRAEPEGTENTSTLSQSPTATSPLIITPVNFYSKGNKTLSSLEIDNNKNKTGSSGATGELRGMMMTENVRPPGTSLLTSDPDYDPYEKAAKQLEELLKTTPIKSSKRSSRRTGLEKAFESVGVPSDMPDMPSLGKSKLGRTQSLDYNSDPFGRTSMKRATDPFGIGSGAPMTPNIDDSYWDQIFRKGDNQHGNNNNNPETISSQEESDTSGTSDTAKSRAMSNTSSADSAFSRSEVNDPEFEALESIVSVGDTTTSTNRYKKTHEDRNKVDLFSTNKLLESHHRTVPRSPSASIDQGRTPMDTTPVSDSRQKSSENSSGSGGAVLAKFCHECGTPYPTSVAKFCPECGEKRVSKT